jgi:hypothetical protein
VWQVILNSVRAANVGCNKKEIMNNTVWILMTDEDDYYNSSDIVSIHASYEGAYYAQKEYEKPIFRSDGSTYHWDARIEEHIVKK